MGCVNILVVKLFIDIAEIQGILYIMSAEQTPKIDKSTILKLFNKQFFEFLDEIIVILPENQEVQIARTTFDTFKRANPTTIIKAWYSLVYKPYETVFDSGNISFFFDKDYATDLLAVPNASRIMEMIDNIRTPIKNMSPENIAHSTKYIQNLCKLSAIYSA
jgi:hypothetical protein